MLFRSVLVLSNGRPLSVNWAVKHAPAIVEIWFPGEQGGAALADVLFGDVNPSGHLAITIPKYVGQIPLNFPAKPGSQAKDRGQVTGPLFPFGFGLSYTQFEYAGLRIAPATIGATGEVTVACDITNTGTRAGTAVPQLYLRDDYSSVTTYEKVLRGFARVTLAPGESREVRFTLRPEDLQLFDDNQRWVVEPGRFTVMVGESSDDIRLNGSFAVARPDGTVPKEAPVGE